MVAERFGLLFEAGNFTGAAAGTIEANRIDGRTTGPGAAKAFWQEQQPAGEGDSLKLPSPKSIIHRHHRKAEELVR